MGCRPRLFTFDPCGVGEKHFGHVPTPWAFAHGYSHSTPSVLAVSGSSSSARCQSAGEYLLSPLAQLRPVFLQLLLRCFHCSIVRICSRAQLLVLFDLFSWSFFYCSAVRLLSVALHKSRPRSRGLSVGGVSGGHRETPPAERPCEGDGEKRQTEETDHCSSDDFLPVRPHRSGED